MATAKRKTAKKAAPKATAKKPAAKKPASKKAVRKAPASKGKKNVYFFGGGKADGDGSQKNLLGGKGANLAEMGLIGIPVPAGFTITTEVCNYYYDNG